MSSSQHKEDSQDRLAEKEYEQAMSLLDMAERLDRECNRNEQTLLHRMILFFGALLLFGIGLVSLSWVTWTADVKATVISVVVVYTILVAFVIFRTDRQIRKDLDRDRRALYAILGILRELEHSLTSQNHMSALARAQLHIRLARLDIGSSAPVSPSPFSRQ
jgi:hypothetical protein